MHYKIYTKEEFKESKWSGGTTLEMAIYPHGTKYVEREFIWRISSAKIKAPESNFTRLDEYERILMVLAGEVILVHEGVRSICLRAMEKDSFDGAWSTKSFGEIVDFNLMFKKGCRGTMEMVELQESPREIQSKTSQCLATGENTGIDEKECSNKSWGFYCHKGYGVVNIAGETMMVREGDFLSIDLEGEKTAADISVMGDGILIMTEVGFNLQEIGAIYIPCEKTTLEDLKQAAKISYTAFRGSKIVFKGRKNLWYDEELQKCIDRVERVFLPFAIWILGIFAILALSEKLGSGIDVMLVVLGWSIIDFIFISPLIYLLMLPKPIAKHIKKITELSEYEKTIYERDKDKNDRIDRILNKYKISGKNVYKN